MVSRTQPVPRLSAPLSEAQAITGTPWVMPVAALAERLTAPMGWAGETSSGSLPGSTGKIRAPSSPGRHQRWSR